MITIRYDPNGIASSDVDVAMWVTKIIRRSQANSKLDYGYGFSTENVFLGIRLAIVQYRLDYQLVQFAMNSSVWLLNHWGEPISGWAPGFCDFSATMNERILKSMMMHTDLGE